MGTFEADVRVLKPLKTTVTNNEERINKIESLVSKQSEVIENQASKMTSLEAHTKHTNIIIDGVSE